MLTHGASSGSRFLFVMFAAALCADLSARPLLARIPAGGAAPLHGRSPAIFSTNNPPGPSADIGGETPPPKTIDDHRLQVAGKSGGRTFAVAGSGGKCLGRPRSFFQRQRMMIVTAYCPCRRCCGPRAAGVTAAGTCARKGVCAADPAVPFGTVFLVPGYGRAAVEDRGAGITGNRLDVFFADHKTALLWGRRNLFVKTVKTSN